MEKRSILGFVLIGIVLMIWLYWNSGNQQKVAQNNKSKTDSTKALERVQNKTTDTNISKTPNTQASDSLIADSLKIKFGGIFASKVIGIPDAPAEEIIMVETEKVQMEFSSYGG